MECGSICKNDGYSDRADACHNSMDDLFEAPYVTASVYQTGSFKVKEKESGQAATFPFLYQIPYTCDPAESAKLYRIVYWSNICDRSADVRNDDVATFKTLSG